MGCDTHGIALGALPRGQNPQARLLRADRKPNSAPYPSSHENSPRQDTTHFFEVSLAAVSRRKFPQSLFQLGAFADVWELIGCSREFVCLFGRTGNSAANP
jgi:hypothetical protein